MQHKQRFIGFDVARALAILGMIIVNYAVSISFKYHTPIAGDNFFAVVVGLLSGRAAATFVILAGVGASLALASAERAGGRVHIAALRWRLIKRALVLFVIGYLWWISEIWTGDILHFYGLYLVAGALCLTVKDRYLWAIAVSVLIGGALYLWFGAYEIPTIASLGAPTYHYPSCLPTCLCTDCTHLCRGLRCTPTDSGSVATFVIGGRCAPQQLRRWPYSL